MYMPYVELPDIYIYILPEIDQFNLNFMCFTCYTDGMFQSKFPFTGQYSIIFSAFILLSRMWVWVHQRIALYKSYLLLVVVVGHGSQMESLWAKRRGLELTSEPSVPPYNTVGHGGQMESLWAKRRGSVRNPHSDHRFPTPSSKLCQI